MGKDCNARLGGRLGDGICVEGKMERKAPVGAGEVGNVACKPIGTLSRVYVMVPPQVGDELRKSNASFA